MLKVSLSPLPRMAKTWLNQHLVRAIVYASFGKVATALEGGQAELRARGRDGAVRPTVPLVTAPACPWRDIPSSTTRGRTHGRSSYVVSASPTNARLRGALKNFYNAKIAFSGAREVVCFSRHYKFYRALVEQQALQNPARASSWGYDATHTKNMKQHIQINMKELLIAKFKPNTTS